MEFTDETQDRDRDTIISKDSGGVWSDRHCRGDVLCLEVEVRQPEGNLLTTHQRLIESIGTE